MSNELCWLSAVELAAAIREKTVSPVDAVDAVLAQIERIDGDINAFTTVTAECGSRGRESRAREDRRDRARGARPATRRPGLDQGHDPDEGGADDLRLEAQQGFRAGRERSRRRATRGRRCYQRGQDEHTRVRLAGRHPEPALWAYAQSVEPPANAGRLERWRKRRRRGGNGTSRAGYRRRRLGPHPRRAVRLLRDQGQLRARSRLPREPRLEPLARGPDDPHRC